MKNCKLIVFLAFSIITFFCKSVSAQTDIEKEFQMKQYMFVLLKAGPNRDQDSTTRAHIQEGHLNNISRLVKEKKMVLAGPFLDESTYLGIFIFDVSTPEEVVELLSTD